MKYFLLCLLLSYQCSVYGINVTFVNPSVPGTAFWDRVTAAATAAADDLSINLTIIYGLDNRIYNLEAIQKAISAKTKPDYIIFMPYDGNAERTYQALERAQIPYVTIERTLQPREQELVGLPQVKYKYWLGEIFHDNLYAGQLLADSLIAEAKTRTSNPKLSMIGISGSFSGESHQRNEGLNVSVAMHQDVKLLQVVPAIWSRERARNIIHQLTSRFGKIDIAWTASDGMALGVLDSVKSGHGEINPNLVIGGIDWTVEAINKVKTGELTASVGGHIMQAAWALVKIYDHHKGIEVFKKGANEVTYQLELINKDNIMKFFILANQLDWSPVDFRQFTLTHSKQPEYQFSFSPMLKALNESH